MRQLFPPPNCVCGRFDDGVHHLCRNRSVDFIGRGRVGNPPDSGVCSVVGVAFSTLLSLFVVPVAYGLIARRTGSPLAKTHELDAALAERAESNGQAEKAR